jgi:Uncharacterized conserved protein (COG2071)
MSFPSLRSNPFPVDAWFDRSCTLTFAIPMDRVQAMLPGCLSADTYQDRWGFLAVAIVQTRKLRPSGFPAFLGNDFILAGYRLFVRYRSTDGRTLRGLYILRSETDKTRMTILGNLFTRYRYVKTDVRITESETTLVASAARSGLRIELDRSSDAPASPPQGSPFTDWKQARSFSGPMPFTFSHDPRTNRVHIVEGVRSNWKPQPICVIDYHIPFLNATGLNDAILANAFVVRDIPYHWKAGRSETPRNP